MDAGFESGFIDISNYTNLELSFQTLYSLEDIFDNGVVYLTFKRNDSIFSEDIAWLWGDAWDYWDYIYTYIYEDYDSVNIVFYFHSDNSVCDYAGVFIEDILLTGDLKYPNLTYYTPIYWDAPVVVSTESGTHENSWEYYAGEELYIDWSIINDGNLPTGQFRVNLYV